MLLRLAVILPLACCGIFVAISSFSNRGSKDDSIFPYHPALMAVATMVLLPLSIHFISSGRTLKNASNHALINVIVGICVLLGAAAVFVVKQSSNKPHVQSIHAMVGLAAVLLLLTNHVIAIVTSGGASRLNFKSIAHVWIGRISVVLMAAATALGLTTTKWAARTFGSTAPYLAAACIVGIALTIIMSLLQRAASKSSAKATSPAESAKKSN